MNRISAVAILALVSAVVTFGQQPQQSSVTLDGKTITVRYSPEAVAGRKIFGGTVPFGKPWRVGAGNGAVLHTDADLVFKGAVIPKGDYTLYILPEADKWQLTLNRVTGAAAQRYDPKQDSSRIAMILSKPPAKVESCKVTLTKSASRAAKLEVAWEETSATVSFHLDRVAGDTEW